MSPSRLSFDPQPCGGSRVGCITICATEEAQKVKHPDKVPKFRPRTTYSTPSPLALALFSSAAKLRGKSAFLGSNGGGSHVHRNDPKLLSIGHQLTQWWFALRNKKQSRGLFSWSPHPHLIRLGNLDLLPKCCHELRVLTAAQESSAKICSSGRQGTCPPGILIPRDARASPARRASPRGGRASRPPWALDWAHLMLQDRILAPFALTERLLRKLPPKLFASRPIVQTGKLRLGEEKQLSP